MKKYYFVLALVLSSTSILGDGFELLLESVQIWDFDTAAELIKKGVPAARARDVSSHLEKYITEKGSYKPKCISLEELALLTIVYWDFDDKFAIGEMIVNKKIVQKCINAFTKMLKARYPIKKIVLIDEYDASDDRSMEDDNSSALCCRVITGHEKKKNPTWSKHSYGTAIDINPVENPYEKPYKGLVLPANGKDYTDRSIVKKGMIIAGDACHKAFTEEGFEWGGDWDPSPPNGRVDYQHFDIDLENL